MALFKGGEKTRVAPPAKLCISGRNPRSRENFLDLWTPVDWHRGSILPKKKRSALRFFDRYRFLIENRQKKFF